MNIRIDGVNVSLELLKAQKYQNMEVIPVRINSCSNRDYLTLKRGINAGFVEITECEVSTVGTVLARNNANIPLVLIDGDEIVGAMQNRIMNRSLIVPPKSSLKVSVSCTEQGRWHYGRSGSSGIRLSRPHGDIDIIYDRDFSSESLDRINKSGESFNDLNSRESFGDSNFRESFEDFNAGESFKDSDFAADFSTRRAKSKDLFERRSCQSTVWDSIAGLERKTSFRSRTSALNDNLECHRSLQDEYLRHFKLEFGQSGAIFIINGQIKGFELFHNSSIYQDYHEKIFRSYIMEAITNRSSFSCSSISIYEIEAFLRELSYSEYRCSKNEGIGRHMNFANRYGTGSVLFDGRDLVHINYFNDYDPKVNKRGSRRYGSFRDFVDNY